MIDRRVRYLQLAFNDDLRTAAPIVLGLPREERILVEAGTPFIKREGMAGVMALRKFWPHGLVADIKTTDGGAEEIEMVAGAGATAATVMGSCPQETLEVFIAACDYYGVDSLIDMLGVIDPLAVMRGLSGPPTGVVLHLGRDEESTRGKAIQYRHVTRVRSKFAQCSQRDIQRCERGGGEHRAPGQAVARYPVGQRRRGHGKAVLGDD